MYSIQSTPEEAVSLVVKKLIESLHEGKMLWLVCGGSNVPYIVEILNQVRKAISEEVLMNLTLGLTDEKFTDTDTEGTNWKQLKEGGLDVSGINTAEIFKGQPLTEVIDEYTKLIEDAIQAKIHIIMQIGIAQDGHCVGVLPRSSGVTEKKLVATYRDGPHTRVTLSLAGLTQMSCVHSFVFGESKHTVIQRLFNEEILAEEMPSQILKNMPEVYIYTDQLRSQKGVT